MSISLSKAKERFADNLTQNHIKTNVWTWNLSQGLVHLTKGLEEIDAKLDALLKAQQLGK
jgi:hypothetical protein